MTNENAIEQIWAMMAENTKKQEQTSLQIAEVSLQIKETERILESVGIQLGNIGHNNGDFAEEYFQNALKDKMEFAGLHFDSFGKNVSWKKGKVQDEFDFVMTNGTAVALIELKYHVHISDVEKMVTKKLPNFRTLFPDLANHKIYLGIGSMAFNDEILEAASNLGIGILKQKGETIEIDTSSVKAY
jgi:hypothetical protein